MTNCFAGSSPKPLTIRANSPCQAGLKPTIVYPAFEGVVDWMGQQLTPSISWSPMPTTSPLSFKWFLGMRIKSSRRGMAKKTNQPTRPPTRRSTARLTSAACILGSILWEHLAMRHLGGTGHRPWTMTLPTCNTSQPIRKLQARYQSFPELGMVPSGFPASWHSTT